MTLNSFTKFRKQLTPYVEPIRPSQRKGFFKKAYELSRQKVTREEDKEGAKEDARTRRRLRVELGRVMAHLENAHVEIRKAGKHEFYARMLIDLDVDKAVPYIERALKEFEYLQSLSVSGIHPELRTPLERDPKFKIRADRLALVPSFRAAEIDYWFISELAQILDRCQSTGRTRLRPVDYHRIISGVFEAAFGETYLEFSVKTALRRIRERQATASKTPIQK